MIKKGALEEIRREFFERDLFRQINNDLTQIRDILTRDNWVERQKDSKNLKGISRDLANIVDCLYKLKLSSERLLRFFTHYYHMAVLQSPTRAYGHIATDPKAVADLALQEELKNIKPNELNKIVSELTNLKNKVWGYYSTFVGYGRGGFGGIRKEGPYGDEYFKNICNFIEKNKEQILKDLTLRTIEQKNLIRGLSKKFHKGVEKIGGDLGKQLDIIIEKFIQRLRKRLGSYLDRNSELLLRRILWNERLSFLKNKDKYTNQADTFSKILEEEYSVIEQKGKRVSVFIRKSYSVIERELRDLEELYKRENREILAFIKKIGQGVNKEDLLMIADFILYDRSVRALLTNSNFRKLVHEIARFYSRLEEFYYKYDIGEEKREMTAEELRKVKNLGWLLKLKSFAPISQIYSYDLSALLSAFAQLGERDVSSLNQIDVGAFKKTLYRFLRENRYLFGRSRFEPSVILALIAVAFLDMHLKRLNYLHKKGLDLTDIVGGETGLFNLIVLDEKELEFLFEKLINPLGPWWAQEKEGDRSIHVLRGIENRPEVFRNANFSFLERFIAVFNRNNISLEGAREADELIQILTLSQNLPNGFEENVEKLAKILSFYNEKMTLAGALSRSMKIFEESDKLDLIIEMNREIPKLDINLAMNLSNLRQPMEVLRHIKEQEPSWGYRAESLVKLLMKYPEEEILLFLQYFEATYLEIREEEVKRVFEHLKNPRFLETLKIIYE